MSIQHHGELNNTNSHYLQKDQTRSSPLTHNLQRPDSQVHRLCSISKIGVDGMTGESGASTTILEIDGLIHYHQWTMGTGRWLQMKWLSFRNNQLRFKTSEIYP
jgi:hypothetical protein